MSLVQLIDFPDLSDDRGGLVALEANKHVPFEIKRVYYIFGVLTGESRGYHAHRRLKQIVVCVSGKCKMVLKNGEDTEEVLLNSPKKGLLIDSCIWREMHDFSEDCVLLVLASEPYDESDYIRDFETYLKEIKQ